jgi:glycosyltransferase involved in cell wall biosynthesis
MFMDKFISIVIPNFNAAATIGKCLKAALASKYANFEVVVVDDGSTDNSVELIKRHPVRLIRLDRRRGAAAARNRGAENSRGEILFFIDADCLLREDALTLANKAMARDPDAVIGGTYTRLPFDSDFFSAFQSLFIHYSETKRAEPDYIATHAMVISAGLFRASGGFTEEFLPILEDVEFSHRLRRSGTRLVMKPELQVTHIFNFNLSKSLANALRKSMYWTVYSLANRDLLKDSGTASWELKVNVAAFCLNALLVALWLYSGKTGYLAAAAFIFTVNLFLSCGMLSSFFRAKGCGFTIKAALYYTLIYPFAVGAGAFAGVLKHVLNRGRKRIGIS